ncbi:hybrid sensor histidine kinase/response regulator transcription factor [Mucilaginibacter sp. L196]|uniref:hybrid sensor histidine kinase/response regulator transcription factor n=1 Tax=Mucilaginibacter sp. L196 TaxID=1641870 RepID=UPI00131AFF6E|nr:hybrid sensor histidine kinase/response regulator transcription factor [Mucilaginibacter sp. L196]
MSIRLLTILTGSLLFSLFCRQAHAQHKFNVVHYSTKDGLSHNGVLCIMRDREGFMWFGTFDGINRFDGHNFVVYKSRPGDRSPLKTNKIRYIVEDQKGYLWIQTFDYQICHFDKKTERFCAIADSTNKKLFPTHVIIDRVIVDPVNGVWLLTKNQGMYYAYTDTYGHPGVVYFSSNKVGSESLKGDFVNFIGFGPNNRIWVGTDKGINCLKRNGSENIPSFTNDVTTERLFPICGFSSETMDGQCLYFGTQDGRLLKLDYTNRKITTIPVTNTRLNDICKSQNGILYISTEGKGIYFFDTALLKAELIPESANNAYLSATEDKSGNIWIEPKENGVVRYNRQTKAWKYYEQQRDFSSTSRQFNVETDPGGTVWVSMKGGGFGYYNDVDDKIEYLFDKPNSSEQKFSNVVNYFYIDKRGVIWVSGKDGGVNKIISLGDKFKQTSLTANSGNRSANEVRAMMKDHEGRLWACTKAGGLYVFDHTKRVNVFASGGNQIGNVYDLLEDTRGNIWLATKGNGLFKATPKDKTKKSYILQNFRHNVNDINSLSNDDVYSVIEDHKHRIWIATLGGGLNLLTQSGNTVIFNNYNNTFHNYPYNWAKGVRYLCEDNSGNIWAATNSGLLIVNDDINGSFRFIFYQKKPGDLYSLSNNSVQHIYMDHKGRMWIGTFGGGLDLATIPNGDINKARFKSYTVDNGLSNDVVLSLTGDQDGNLWIATAGGLSKFNPLSQSFQNYDSFDGLPDAQFSESTCFTANDGSLYFGCTTGYISFKPQDITRKKLNANMALTHLQLYYKEVLPGDEHSPLKYAINETRTLTLSHDQNVISIDYAVLDYRAEKEAAYSYKLAGFDTDWHNVNDQQKATYTNIPPGTYTFYVKGVNNELFSNQPEKSLQIIVKPPYYLTIWAKISYVILAIIIGLIARNIIVTMIRLRNKVQIERKLTEIKLAFFTNVSHELRTPLTLIAGPLQELAEVEGLSEKNEQYFKVINRNVSRMMRFTNQLLDFRKVQSGKIQLKITESDVVALAHNVGDCFATIAAEKNILFDVSSNHPVIKAWFDEEKLEIILYNLLSNAFKFSPSGKLVHVDITASATAVEVRVVDQGKGVPPEKLKEIFEIYHEDNYNKENHLKGTGIGLALAKGLALSHKGSLHAELNEYGGLTLILTLKPGYLHYNKEELMYAHATDAPNYVHPDANEFDNSFLDIKTNHSTEVPLVLIVEDNPDLRSFLSMKLAENYRIQIAQDGLEGLAMARESFPDLIISDVLMPRMDGIQMLDELKNDSLTSHVPLILLTAKSSVESRIEGLKYGADIYMTKPFNNKVLIASIDNLLKSRKRLFEKIAGIADKAVFTYEPENLITTSKDEEFLKDVIKLVEDKMTDPNFNIDEVAAGIGMGRTTFYKKLKSLTSLSPVEFVRELRIKRSKQLLDTGMYTISEAGYMAGFNSLAYFSTCFKEKYKLSPSAYLKKIKETTV